MLISAVLRCGERDFMDAIIRKAIIAKDINHKGQGLWVTMRKLLGDFAQVSCPLYSLQLTCPLSMIGRA